MQMGVIFQKCFSTDSPRFSVENPHTLRVPRQEFRLRNQQPVLTWKYGWFALLELLGELLLFAAARAVGHIPVGCGFGVRHLRVPQTLRVGFSRVKTGYVRD